jgi:hypothetical protein
VGNSSWLDIPSSYKPTVLLGRLPAAALPPMVVALASDGWDVRTLPGQPSVGARAAELITAALEIQPDLLVAAGTTADPWAFEAIRSVRTAPPVMDLGLVVMAHVEVPSELDVTPMTGPDAWIFPDEDPTQILDTIRRTAEAALESRLPWAQRDWTPSDRRRDGLKALSLLIEQGAPVQPSAMADRLYGLDAAIDIRVWDGETPHPAGWRFGATTHYPRALLIQPGPGGADDPIDTRYQLFSRSGQLLLSACTALVELSGGWPTIQTL